MEIVVASVLLGWFAVSSLVVGLCMAAARGDADGAVAAGPEDRSAARASAAKGLS